MQLFNAPNTNNGELETMETTSTRKSAEQRYRELDSKNISELTRPTEPTLPLPDEVIKARQKRDSEVNSIPNTDLTTTQTPQTGMCSEDFLLPSKGLLYGDNFDGHFSMRMFTTKEERIRLSSNENFLHTMAAMLNNCITTANGTTIDTKWFTEFDFIYTMYKARILSYGNIYKVSARCPHCGRTFVVETDLDKLKVLYLPDDFKEPFEIGPLPMSKDILQLRLLRVNDNIEIEQEAKDILEEDKNYVGNPTINLTLEHIIMSINGKQLHRLDVRNYVDNLPAADYQYIRHKINNIKAGLILDGVTDCTNKDCNAKVPYSLAVNSTFFRPEFAD